MPDALANISEDDFDRNTFEQILEMDDDEDDRDFSKGIVYGFFEQADSTMQKLDDQVRSQDLQALSELGHFLKGSSATLGLTGVRDCCEKIQNLGKRLNEDGTDSSAKDDFFLQAIKTEIVKLKRNYQYIEKKLRTFYGEHA